MQTISKMLFSLGIFSSQKKQGNNRKSFINMLFLRTLNGFIRLIFLLVNCCVFRCWLFWFQWSSSGVLVCSSRVLVCSSGVLCALVKFLVYTKSSMILKQYKLCVLVIFDSLPHSLTQLQLHHQAMLLIVCNTHTHNNKLLL